MSKQTPRLVRPLPNQRRNKKMEINLSSSLKTWGKILGVTFVVLLIGLIIFRIAWVTTIDNYELGFSYDRVSGKIEKIEVNGWVVRTPFRYSVHTVDLRPYQVSISANSRILNAKLVRFNPNGLNTFVEWHGRNAADQTFSLLEILKCYAFDKSEGRDCPFLEVISELAPNQGPLTHGKESTKQ